MSMVRCSLLAAGTDLQSRGVATMIRGVHESTIRHYMRLFESEPALREANDALLHFGRTHSMVLVATFGACSGTFITLAVSCSNGSTGAVNGAA